jgi:outer membrane protein TolC
MLTSRTAANETSSRPLPRVLLGILTFVTTASAAAAQPAPITQLTLGGAARMAAERSANAVTSRERAYQSGARSVQMRSDLLPTITSGSTINGGDDTPFGFASGSQTSPTSGALNQRTVSMRLEVTQRIFDLPAIRRWQAAAADAHVAGANARVSAEQAAQRGALAYLRVLRAQAQLEARLADSSLAAELLEIARQQLTAGTAIALDVTRSESQLASTVSQLITTRNERGRAELELLRVLALPVDTRLELGDSLRAPRDGDVAVAEKEAVRVALGNRAEIVAAMASADAARRHVGAARAERMPAISVFGTTGSSADGIMDRQTYGVQVTVPLFDGFRREARVAEGRSQEREADAQWQDSKLRAEVEVRSAMLDVGAARERVVAARVQLGLAEQEVSQARSRFSAGVASNADVINASLSLNGARDQVVDALTAYHVARVSFASAQGLTTELR